MSDYKTAAGLETKAHLLKRPLQADVLGTYLVGPYDKSVSADRDLATKIERCIH